MCGFFFCDKCLKPWPLPSKVQNRTEAKQCSRLSKIQLSAALNRMCISTFLSDGLSSESRQITNKTAERPYLALAPESHRKKKTKNILGTYELHVLSIWSLSLTCKPVEALCSNSSCPPPKATSAWRLSLATRAQEQTFRHSAAISSPNNRPGSRPSRHIPPQRRCEGSLTAGACLCERPVRPEERQATSALLGLHLQGAVWWKRGHIRPRSKYEICNIEHQKWCWNANANLTQ